MKLPCRRLQGHLIPLLPAAFALACGRPFDDDNEGQGETGGPGTDFFSAACIGTLTQEVALQERAGPETWTGVAATGQVGQEVLVAAATFERYGYLFVDGEVTHRVGTAPFELGVHFAADCDDGGHEPLTAKVALLDAAVYEDDQRSGAPCTIEAGTVLGGAYFFAYVGEGLGQTASEALPEICGFDMGFTPDLVTDSLVRPP